MSNEADSSHALSKSESAPPAFENDDFESPPPPFENYDVDSPPPPPTQSHEIPSSLPPPPKFASQKARLSEVIEDKDLPAPPQHDLPKPAKSPFASKRASAKIVEPPPPPAPSRDEDGEEPPPPPRPPSSASASRHVPP